MGNKKHVAKKSHKSKVIPIQIDATFFFERAVQSLDRHHYEKALKYFRLAAEYDPENPVNHCNLAGILSEVGNYEESNRILKHILDEIDSNMTECYFYMANNYANMEDYELAEKALVHYLENDPNGHFLEETEEMIDFLSYELDRPTQITSIKSREDLFEHDKARALLEEGKFSEAVRLLEKLIDKYPDFTAARNNLALAYYYMGRFEKAMETIQTVMELDSGNLHALCNLAILYQHSGDEENLQPLRHTLRKTVPFHPDHAFKLATTMGILGEHEKAYRLFKMLLKNSPAGNDPCFCHYLAVSANNTGRYEEAAKFWRQAEKLDPQSSIPPFYLSQLQKGPQEGSKSIFSYHYHLPFEEQFRLLDKMANGIPEQLKRDPLVRSSFFWALQHGDHDTKLQVIQAFSMIADSEVETALREFLLQPDEDDYLKKVAVFVLRSMRVKDPLSVVLEGKRRVLKATPWSPNLPVWKEKWQNVMETALQHMEKRYDMIQQHDLQTLWVEFLSRVFPGEPKISKVEGWAAALEYLTAKMHRRTISYHEVAVRYGISISTVSKNVKMIDQVCGLKEKMAAILPKLSFNDTL